MRNKFIVLLSFLFLISVELNAQLTVTMSSVEVDKGGQASVDVTVNGFTNLLGVQFSINFDSLVMSYIDATNFTAALPGLSSAAVSGPNGVGVKKGQMTFSWFDQQGTGKSLANGTRLFTILLNASGAKCAKTDVITSNTPRAIEVVNASFNNVALVNNKGVVTIKCDVPPVTGCTSPTCANANNLTFTGAVKEGKPNNIVCIPISVKNFKAIQSGQGTYRWDTTLLTFIEFKVPTTGGIPMFDGGINSNNVATGQLGFVWSNPTPGTPLTLSDNTVIIELCFRVKGPVGQSGCVIIGQGTIPSEWTANSGEVPVCFSYGKIDIKSAPPANTVILRAGSGTGLKDATVCIDVTVDEFKAILGANTTFSWNSAQLQFVRTDMYNLEGLNSTAFSNTASTLKFLWISQAPITKPNGHRIFQICFKLLSPCDGTVAINVPGPTEIVGDGSVVIPNNTIAGSIKINCVAPPPTCTLGTITHVTCIGASDGAIALNVVGESAGCNCSWKNAAGTVVKASGLVSSGCNLTGMPAGTYTYEVTCNSTVVCTGSATINQPTGIVIPLTGVVTNVACGQKGAISISPSGGTPGYTYVWSPAQGSISNPSNLNAGTYSVTVSDQNKCTATASFTVGNAQSDLVVTSTVTNVKCRGTSTGAILLNITGGCPPSSVIWTGGLTGVNPQNVAAGTYSATITDTSVPAQTKTVSVTVMEPSTNVAVSVTNINNTTGTNNGSITISITGGTPSYKVIWTGGIPDGNTTGTLTVNGLAPGIYSLTVTDTNNCTVTRAGIEVKAGVPEIIAPAIGSSSVTSDFKGFGVPCNGNTNGSVKVTLSAGTGTMTATLKLGTQTIRTTNVSTNDIVFSELGAGTYIVEVTNSKGSVNSAPLVITQPTKLAAGTPKVTCSNINESTGSIELDLGNTGTKPYGITWSGLTAKTEKVLNLKKDVYNVTILDANGCELKISNIEVGECPRTGDCFVASSVITPNGDRFNDVFVINCVQNNPSDLTIFDRWGRTVYSKINYDNSWQGVDNSGNDLKESAYMWVLTVNFGQGRKEVYKGTVTLLRSR